MLKKILIIVCTVAAIFSALAAVLYPMYYFNLIPSKVYTAEDFGVETITSGNDADNDGIDDYTDILLSARKYLNTRPKYKSRYYHSGYPPDGEGMCTDVIWRAFKGAGYSLKDLIDKDIAENVEFYPGVNGKPDTNIDFRRVRNLLVFFRRNAQSLTLDINEIDQWQPGDIVVFDGHIAIISDKRNKDGIPYILHNGGRPVYEENALSHYNIIGHFRWTYPHQHTN